MLLATSLLTKLMAICLNCCDSVLLTHLQPCIHHNPKVLLVKAVSQPLASQTVPMHGFILLYEEFILLFSECCKVSIAPGLKFLHLTQKNYDS